MREKTYHLYLNEEERSRVIQSLIELKNNLAAQGRYTDAVDDTVLHQVLQIAVDDDFIRNNPSDNVLRELKKAHCFQSEKRRALTKPEQAAFLISKNFFEIFLEKRRFWVCISYPSVQMSEGVHSG